MNLDRLAQFVRIAETGSMSQAALVIHVTQPALSRSMKLLEEELGIEVFERRGRGLVLTAAGRSLLPRARALLAEAESVARDVAQVAARDYYDVRIGTVDSVATWLLPRVLAPLRAAFPDLHLKLTTARTARLLERLEAGGLDLAIVAWSGPPPTHRATRVGPYQLRFYGRADRFLALADVTSDDEVSALPLVEIEPQPGQPTMIPEDARTFAVANSLASVKALVLAGFGVGALLDFVLSPAERALLVTAPLPHDPDCALFLAGAASYHGETPARIEATLADALRGALAEPASAGSLV